MMLSGKIPLGIQVVKEYDRSLPQIPAYAAELNQVWTNLIDNAVSAMNGSGTLTVRTGKVREDEDEVFVEFGDTGPGVPPEIKTVYSNRSSPPSRWAREPASGWTSRGASW
jgi:Signal transduction histidine kinase